MQNNLKKDKYMYTYKTESLCCTCETLRINYSSIFKNLLVLD